MEKQYEQSFFYDAAKKIIMTLFGVLLIYLIFYVGVLIRNGMLSYYYIGQADRPQNIITVEGSAEVDVVPDVGTVRLGIQVQEETQQAAQDSAAEVMNQLIDGLQEMGVAKEDIKTDSYNVSPWYVYTEGEREQDGFQANQNVTVTIRDTEMSDEILAYATEVGANTIGGLDFQIDDPEVYRDKARKEAIKDAYANAKELQDILGVRFVRVVSYHEYGGDGNPQPYYAYSFDEMARGGAIAPKIETGTNEVSMNVSITFEIR